MTEDHRRSRRVGHVPSRFECLAVRRLERESLAHRNFTTNQMAAAPMMRKAKAAVAIRSHRVCMGFGG